MRHRRLLTRRDVALGGATAAVVGIVLVLQLVTMTSSRAPGFLQLDLVFRHPESRAEAMVARMDGHFTAEIAADPTLHRVRRDFRTDPTDGAYRATRPLPAWTAWAMSLGGQRVLLAPAILALAAISAGALVVAVSLVARSLGWEARAPWLVLLAPGVALTIWNPGLTEVIATTLALGGFVAHRRGRLGWAALLFALAVLSRETVLLVPAALALGDVLGRRRWRDLWWAAVPVGVYVGWSRIVQVLLGFTAGSGGARQLSPPGVGLLQSRANWTELELAAALVVALCVVVAWRSGDREVRLVVLAHLAFASVMGSIVWSSWWGFSRVLLPLAAFAVASYRVEAADESPATPTADPAVDDDRCAPAEPAPDLAMV